MLKIFQSVPIINSIFKIFQKKSQILFKFRYLPCFLANPAKLKFERKNLKLIETFLFHSSEKLGTSKLEENESIIIIPLKQLTFSTPKILTRIQIEELFTSPFIKLLEIRNEERKYEENQENNNNNEQFYIINQIKNQDYHGNKFDKEEFILNTFAKQFEKLDLKSICNVCSIKPIKLYSSLMPNVYLISWIKKLI